MVNSLGLPSLSLRNRSGAYEKWRRLAVSQVSIEIGNVHKKLSFVI